VELRDVAGANMVGDWDEPDEMFEWVSSYSITHFDFPFLSFGHPTLGDNSVEKKYNEDEWRRVALKDGKVIGGVLIGDLSPQSALKRLAREQVDMTGREEKLLEERIPVDELVAESAEAQAE